MVKKLINIKIDKHNSKKNMNNNLEIKKYNIN